MAGKSSQLSIDSDVKSNGKGNRLRMKWKAVPLWYVVFLSIMTLSNAEGRWNIIRPVMSFKGNTGDERFIVPYSGTGANNDIIGERLRSLRGGAAVNLFPSGYVTVFRKHTFIPFASLR